MMLNRENPRSGGAEEFSLCYTRLRASQRARPTLGCLSVQGIFFGLISFTFDTFHLDVDNLR